MISYSRHRHTKEHHLFRKGKASFILPDRFWMMIVIMSILLLVTACGNSSAASANPAQTTGNVPPTSESIAAAAQDPSSAGSPSNAADACSLLTKEDVGKVLGATVETAVASGQGGVCTYTSANLSIDFTIAGHTGGAKAMGTTLANLGDLALVVPGLGDQAFYNTNSANALFVLKGDAEYLFGMSDVNYQPLDPAVVQATEKALAEQLLSHLP
jgi:hypothetical protein